MFLKWYVIKVYFVIDVIYLFVIIVFEIVMEVCKEVDIFYICFECISE